MTDWADEMEDKIYALGDSLTGFPPSGAIADALRQVARKSMADGMREAVKRNRASIAFLDTNHGKN